jgi:hypothetical protein
MILGMSTEACVMVLAIALIALGVVAARRFHPGAPAPAPG